MTAGILKPPTPRVCDNDTDIITVTLGAKALTSLPYETEVERRLAIALARAFQAGWLTCHDAKGVAA